MPSPMTAHPADAGSPRHLRIVDDATARHAHEAAIEAARERALTLLTLRARTRSEVATALERRGTAPEIVTEVLDRLTAVGLLDDAAYAQAYVEREGARRGPRAVADALRRRGVPAAAARQAAFAADPQDVRASALEVARAALPRWRGLEQAVVARRMAALLTRRGYDRGVVLGVTREVAGQGLEGLDTDDG